MGTILFYDTNAIMECVDLGIVKDYFAISSTTLMELEHIKTGNKDQEVKYKARETIHFLNDSPDLYDVVIYDNTINEIMVNHKLSIDHPDNQICACCEWYSNQVKSNIVFITNDLCCKSIADRVFNLYVKTVDELISDTVSEIYVGYKDVTLTDEEMSNFYTNTTQNNFNCLVNQYLIIRKSDGDIVDIQKWNGEQYQKVPEKKVIKSTLFGDKIKPKDVYQTLAIDSILSNTLTAISGKAGSGKSLISLITMMNLIETGKYDRIIIMFNPTKAKGASDMGFYTGSALEKGMQNSIGSILTTKFGDPFAVDLLLQQDKIRLVSMADIRGMEVRDNEILYISECQNTSVELLKLCLSRASSGCKIVIEGDFTSQVDSYQFAGSSNGLKRVIDTFKNRPEFGYINLPNIWRSKIAELCELL